MTAEIPWQGTLVDVPFLALLGALYRQQRTGVLHITWDALEKIFWIDRDAILAVQANTEGEHWIDFLLPAYGERFADLEPALRELPFARFLHQVRDRLHIPGDVLRETLRDAILFNVRHILFWPRGDYFWDDETVPEDFNLVRVWLPEAIWNAIQSLHEPDQVLRQLHMPIPARVPRLRPEAMDPLTRLDLTPRDAYFLSLLDGGASLEQLLKVGQIERMRALQLMTLVLLCGWAEPVHAESPVSSDSSVASQASSASTAASPEPSHAASRDRIPFAERVINFFRNLQRLDDDDIFQLGRTTTLEEIDARYRELMEEYDPARCADDPHLVPLEPMLIAIRQRIRAAYERLRERVPTREEREAEGVERVADAFSSGGYWHLRGAPQSETRRKPRKLPHTPKEFARLLYNRAMEYIQVGDNWRAAQTLEAAIEQDPEVAEYYYWLGVVYEGHPRLHPKAAHAYMKALELDPDNRNYLAHLAALLFRNKQYRQAKRFLERLVELDPGNQEARRMLREVQREVG